MNQSKHLNAFLRQVKTARGKDTKKTELQSKHENEEAEPEEKDRKFYQYLWL